MSNKLLFPNKYKLIGWCLLIPTTIFGVILSFTEFDTLPLTIKVFAFFNTEIMGPTSLFSFIEANLTNTIVGALFIVGGIFVGFSKEKREDEFIAKIRLSSLLWAVWVNYALLLLAVLLVYGSSFFTVMVYNMFTVLLIFIFRFNYILYKSTKIVSDDK